MRTILLLSLLGVLLLSSCGGDTAVYIYNDSDRRIGRIEVQDENSARVFNLHGEEMGRVRGSLIRDAEGARRGSVAERDGKLLILDGTGEPVGSLESGTDCYGKGEEKLGYLSADMDREASAAGCLLFFLK